MSKCEEMNCGYYWQGERDRYPRCHCELPEGQAPCEVEENSDEE